MNLKGKHALVTGAGSGIGAAIARALAGAGAKVTLAGRRREPLEQVAKSIKGRTLAANGFDVTDPVSIEHGLALAHKAFGPIDILVNNAGEAVSLPFEKLTEEVWSRIIAVDLTSVYRMTQAVLPDLKARGRGARVINIASVAGLTGAPYITAYCAAKHGVIGLTRALAQEMAKTGITVNAVCPGYTDTPLIDKAVANIIGKTGRSEAEVRASLNNPQGGLVTPEEVAETVLWLAAGAASVNGQAIVIDGGEVMAG